MNNGTIRCLLDVVKLALWNTDISKEEITQDVFEEMKKHAIETLPANVLSKLSMSSCLRKMWQQQIIKLISFNYSYQYIQSTLPLTVPYAILKGTSAAQYYPNPEYRYMGDIDIIVVQEAFSEACSILLGNGYYENTEDHDIESGRHRSFIKNGIQIEIHLFFSQHNDTKKGKCLDNLIIKNINPSHNLPDSINGLVLLEHINQHLAEGLGLRQIIDWMMFVDKCLPDEKWLEFQEMAQMVGLETLAITTTRMCEMYLGLPQREWCATADKALCQELMDYVLSCGNFGNKKNDESSMGEGVFGYVKSVGTFFHLLHMRGMVNWPAAKRHVWLRPFAWIYQLGRYLVKGLGRDKAVLKLKKEYAAAKKKNNLLDRLEVRRSSD